MLPVCHHFLVSGTRYEELRIFNQSIILGNFVNFFATTAKMKRSVQTCWPRERQTSVLTTMLLNQAR